VRFPTAEVAVFQRLFPILSTGDLPRLLGFYRDLLGATVAYQFEHEGQVVYAGLDLGPSHLGIGAAAPDAPELGDAGRRFAMWVYADDCDAAVGHLRANGVQVTVEPADQPWGERVAEVADPDGNRVVLASGAAPGPAG
jgi:lactoylglutathione lyase